jgi:predicted ATPase
VVDQVLVAQRRNDGLTASRRWNPLFLQSGIHFIRAEYHPARELGEELLRLGQECGDKAAQIMGGHQLGVALFSLGEFALARAQFEEMLALYEPEQHRNLAFLYAQNPRVTALSWLPLILFALGYPEQAVGSAPCPFHRTTNSLLDRTGTHLPRLGPRQHRRARGRRH